jgi:diguanylate cyclase (GGDEF)-like protein
MRNNYVKPAIFILCFIYALVMHWFDLRMVGPEMTFTLLYLIPISIAAWFSGVNYGIIVGFLCSLLWLHVYIVDSRIISLDHIIVTNIVVKLSIFISYAIIVGRLKEVLDREKAIARIDNLTGLANSKAFIDALSGEIDRSMRYQRVISLIYMDVDNFKTVNDSHGHNVGDKALKETAKVLKYVFRASDTAARMGGDEFAVLLPETDNVSAMIAAEKLRGEFQKMAEKNQWPISLSIGVATFTNPPRDGDQIIKLADDLMYAAKRNGKNNIKNGTMVKW